MARNNEKLRKDLQTLFMLNRSLTGEFEILMGLDAKDDVKHVTSTLNSIKKLHETISKINLDI